LSEPLSSPLSVEISLLALDDGLSLMNMHWKFSGGIIWSGVTRADDFGTLGRFFSELVSFSVADSLLDELEDESVISEAGIGADPTSEALCSSDSTWCPLTPVVPGNQNEI
jgi:hypothetical protein